MSTNPERGAAIPESRPALTRSLDVEALDFTKGDGVITIVAQDAISGRVLMQAFADREALERTIATGEMHYRSRTRGLWHKGATSGNTQRVVSLTADCDGDAVLARVVPAGPACHTGAASCFGAPAAVLDEVDALVAARAAGAVSAESAKIEGAKAEGAKADSVPADGAPAGGVPAGGGYTDRLLRDRNLRLKKIGEEASEFVLACADGDARRAVEEAADVVYHVLVALRAAGGSLDDLQRTLRARRDRSRPARPRPA